MTPSSLPNEKTNLTRHFPQTINVADLLALDLPPREDLVSPWLREGESMMLYAEPGVGKSFVALALALAVAGGGRLLDRWTAPRPRRVLYVDGEMPLDDIRDRVALLMPAAGGDGEAIRRNLHFMARHRQSPDTAFIDLAREDSREALLTYAQENKIDLIILDNLSTLATIDDENAASAFNAPVAFLLRLKQCGLACLLVHHSNKGGKSYRGSCKIATTFEVILSVESNPKHAGETATCFKLSWKKYRRKKSTTTGMDLDVSFVSRSEDKDGLPCPERAEWICDIAEDQRIAVFVDMVTSCRYATQREVVAAWPGGGMTNPTLSRIKEAAVSQGWITQKRINICFAEARVASSDKS